MYLHDIWYMVYMNDTYMNAYKMLTVVPGTQKKPSMHINSYNIMI